MQDYVAPAVDGVINFGARTERGDDHEDLVRFARAAMSVSSRAFDRCTIRLTA
jgi:hypothetical protein